MGHARRVIFDLVGGQLAVARAPTAIRLALAVRRVADVLRAVMERALYGSEDVVPHAYFPFPLPNTLALMDS